MASLCTHRIGNQSGRSGTAALVRGLSRLSLLRPRNAFDSTARVARSPCRAGHLVQQPGCIARSRRHGLYEGLDQHRSTRRNRVLSLSDDDGWAAAYRHDRTVTSGDGFVGPVCSGSQGGVHRGDDIQPAVSNPLIVRGSRAFRGGRRSSARPVLRCGLRRSRARGAAAGRWAWRSGVVSEVLFLPVFPSPYGGYQRIVPDWNGSRQVRESVVINDYSVVYGSFQTVADYIGFPGIVDRAAAGGAACRQRDTPAESWSATTGSGVGMIP